MACQGMDESNRPSRIAEALSFFANKFRELLGCGAKHITKFSPNS